MKMLKLIQNINKDNNGDEKTLWTFLYLAEKN